MREIKFRGLRTDGNGWVYGNLINWHPTLKPRIVWFEQQGETSEELDFKETNYEVIPESVGQLTGLTDKNGKDIYEGDILKTIGKNVKITFGTSSKYPTSFLMENEYVIMPFENTMASISEIIGTIHENSELLK